MLKAHKINQFHYWVHQINTNDLVLEGRYGAHLLSQDSVFVYVGFMHHKKGLFKTGWSSHKNSESALGFIQHVFMPSGYYTWIDKESEGFYFPLSTFDVLRMEVLKQNDYEHFEVKKEDIRFSRYYDELRSLWGEDNKKIANQLKQISSRFNTDFNNDPKQLLFFKVFSSAEEISSYILENIDSEFEEVIEEEINMSINDLHFLCQNVYDQPLINRTFIETLNELIPIWF